VELKSLIGNAGGALIKSWGALIYRRLFSFFGVAITVLLLGW